MSRHTRKRLKKRLDALQASQQDDGSEVCLVIYAPDKPQPPPPPGAKLVIYIPDNGRDPQKTP
jgi:hypothetical protein